MDPEISLGKFILTITLLVVMTTPILLSTSNAETMSTKPSWAKPGVTLVYSWDLLEYQPIEKLDDLITIRETNPGGKPALILTLLSVNETHGVFQAMFPSIGQIGEMICKWDGSKCLIGPVGNAKEPFSAIYRPPETLKEYPLVFVGNAPAFKIEENITEPGRNQRLMYYYHKDTGILVLSISISYSTIVQNTADFSAMVLISTNAISARPYWAFPGFKASYAVTELNVSASNIKTVVEEVEKNYTYYASLEPTYIIEILETNESNAMIRWTNIKGNRSSTGNYTWALGTAYDVYNDRYMYNDWYRPPELLSEYPLAIVGNYQVYKVSGKDYLFYSYYHSYHHKDTGIRVLRIWYRCLNETCRLYISALTSLSILPRTYVGEVVARGERFVVNVVSNSTVSGFTYNEFVSEISFEVTGPSGLRGFCNVSVPKALVKPGYVIKVYFNNNPIDYVLNENSTHYFIYFTYMHSTHRVIIKFEATQTTNQDFTVIAVAGVIIGAVAIAVLYSFKRRK